MFWRIGAGAPPKPRFTTRAYGHRSPPRRALRGNSTALVGTPETVAKALLEYYKLGSTSLLIRGYDPRPDTVQYGEELIPRLRALVADHDAASGTRSRNSLEPATGPDTCAP